MTEALNWLRGKKTYLSAVVAAVLGLLHAFGHITTDQFEALVTLTGAAGLAALRAGMSDTVKKIVSGEGTAAVPTAPVQ